MNIIIINLVALFGFFIIVGGFTVGMTEMTLANAIPFCFISTFFGGFFIASAIFEFNESKR
jgi:ABC-type polysaccharide/polyol phosphate export permease